MELLMEIAFGALGQLPWCLQHYFLLMLLPLIFALAFWCLLIEFELIHTSGSVAAYLIQLCALIGFVYFLEQRYVGGQYSKIAYCFAVFGINALIIFMFCVFYNSKPILNNSE